MKPSPVLAARLRFSTKDVGKGFYRGNRTGSVGAHTPKGGYLIDYRKVRSYQVPDLKNFSLTPYVTREIITKETPEEIPAWEEENEDGSNKEFQAQDLTISRRRRALKFLNEWRQLNPGEFQTFVEYQKDSILQSDLARAESGERIEVLERLKRLQQRQETEKQEPLI